MIFSKQPTAKGVRILTFVVLCLLLLFSDANNLLASTAPEAGPTPQHVLKEAIETIESAENESIGAIDAGERTETAEALPSPANMALHKSYTVSIPANDSYADPNGTKLTDGAYGGTDFSNPAWVGHNANIDREIVIDLQEAKSISAIKANFLSDNGVGITAPELVTFFVSQDGVQWSKVKNVIRPRSNQSVSTALYEWNGNRDGFPKHQPNGQMAYARYVKMHTIVDYWMFIDEIEVLGYDGKQNKAVELTPDPAIEPEYLQAGEQTGYMNDLVLFYNGQYAEDAGNWNAEQFVPYVAYVDENGQPLDWMFDSGLFLGITAPSGRSFAEGTSPSNKEDWDWYIAKTLSEPASDAAQLNVAVRQTAQQLGEPNHKMKVAIMVPMPDSRQTDFGDVDGDGVSENLSNKADQEKVLRWYVREVTQKWKKSRYNNLELTGFYWMSETVTELNALQYTADLVHRNKLKFYWIPYYEASLYWKWQMFGFDAMAYQPNHYFAGTAAQRIADAAARAKKIGSGIEIEFDDGVFNLGPGRHKLIDYLQGAAEYGYDGDTFRAYYQDLRTLYKAAYDEKPENRQIYDWIYAFIHGQPLDFTVPGPQNLALNKSYTVSLPPSSSYPDTGGTELTDGIHGTTSFYNAAWQGHAGDFDRNFIVDLGEPKSIGAIKANFLNDRDPGINAPDDIRISVSMDGQNWARAAVVDKPASSDTGPHTLQYVWDGAVDGLPSQQPQGDMVYARYVKINLVLNVWAFIDEIEVWGEDGRLDGAVELTPDEPPQDGRYLEAGEATGGINDLVLFYNGQYNNNIGDWNASQFVPYVAYVDEDGQPTEWFFDGGLFLGLTAASGRTFVETNWEESSKKEDWEWYLNKTFNGDALQLNQAVSQVGAQLNDPNHKMKVVLMVPLPSTKQTDFGDVDGDGVSENFGDPAAGQANKEKAVDWYINEVLSRWTAAGYSNLELTGFYWMHEAASAEDQAVIRYTADAVHKHGFKFFWIPYYGASGYWKWQDFGFDAMAYQPNHFFTDGTTADRIRVAAENARKIGSGVEIEVDDRVFGNTAFRQKYIDYLQGGIDYGFDSSVFRAYYQSTHTLQKAAYSDFPRNRQIYDWTYDFIRGNPIDFTDPGPGTGPVDPEAHPNLALNAAYTVSLPPEPQYPDTNGTELTDGIYASPAFLDDGWQGHAHNTVRDFVIDLGEQKSIAAIKANFLQETSTGIHAPAVVEISVSTDGQNWAKLADVAKPAPTQAEPYSQMYRWDASKNGLPAHQPQGEYVYARYVKIHITLNVWAFIDEIEVRGENGRLDGAVVLTPDP
ncbi:DUF4855 domain-containing protein [Paenibacillus mendelii]|uniref:DUF4855 domain-containing protein n=1 Tax=Paenibacillus mendelii TaxID=206163 RepID=A0ABV6J970_9BACL|nr:DUF4855 domain-containing protein [Paenibacillus mendelii]MCQ6559972.1 DUF4855 domain-containing protein [Paenibacillus mendelii]